MPRKRLRTVSAEPAKAEPVPTTKRRDGSTSNESDRPRLLGTHVTEAAYRQFRITAAELGVNNNKALREAINLWFSAKKKSPIA